MKPLAALVLAAFLAATLAACGVETATTAATSAEIKRREVEAAKNTMQQATQTIDAATKQAAERAGQSDPEKGKD